MGTRQIDAALSETGETRFSRRDALILTFIACLALAVRVLPSSLLHYESSPDEIFQYYEQAHRLVFGSGIVPWEYHEGTRSWFLPIVLASVMYFCSLFSDSPQIYFIACRAILGMLSLSVVYVAYQYLPPRLSEVGRFPVTLLCALFPYLAFFGAVALTETVATHLIFIAFILFRHRWVRRAPLQFMTIGVLLGLAFWLRIQLTPLLLVIGVYFCGVNVVRWCRLGSGFAVSILLVGVILDAITWGAPFHSLWANIHANVIMDVSSSFETTPFLGYLSKVRDHWPAATPLALLLFIGAVRQPIFALCGVVVLLSYSLVPHKELRFMYPALCFLAISLGYGIAEIACWAAQAGWARLRGASAGMALAGVSVSVVAALSIQVQTGDWVRHSGDVLAFLEIRDDPHLCGVAVQGISWWDTGGYATLHRDVPIFFDSVHRVERFPSGLQKLTTVVLNGRELGAAGPYNVLIANTKGVDPAFRKRQCFPNGGVSGLAEICIFDRVSGCTP
jgi:GPI mannosyltransferase 3